GSRIRRRLKSISRSSWRRRRPRRLSRRRSRVKKIATGTSGKRGPSRAHSIQTPWMAGGRAMDRRSFVRSLTSAAALAGAATLLSPFTRTLRAEDGSPTVWSETDGAIKRLTCMLGGAAGERVLPALAGLLAALRPETMVEVLCADRRLLTQFNAARQS